MDKETKERNIKILRFGEDFDPDEFDTFIQEIDLDKVLHTIEEPRETSRNKYNKKSLLYKQNKADEKEAKKKIEPNKFF